MELSWTKALDDKDKQEESIDNWLKCVSSISSVYGKDEIVVGNANGLSASRTNHVDIIPAKDLLVTRILVDINDLQISQIESINIVPENGHESVNSNE